MAKSLRSKWKKRMRAVKRIKYGERELERLKATVANDVYNKKPADELMADISDIATVVDPKKVAKDSLNDDEVEVMDMESKPNRKYNRRTMRDENGTYPLWLSKKRIKQQSIANKKRKAKASGKKVKVGGKRRHR